MPHYVSGYQGSFNPGVTASIASGDTESAVLNLGGFALTGIFLPAAFTGTTLTFEAAPTAGGTFVPVTDQAGDPISYTVAQGTYVAIDPKDFQGIQFIKLVSGSTEGADRTLTCTAKGY